MHVIGVASRKGGSGKTTLTSHLAVAAEAAAAGPVAVIDTDPQGGLAGWWNAREAETPRWIDPANGLPPAVSAARAAGYGLLLIDTPPLLTATISDVMAAADLVLIAEAAILLSQYGTVVPVMVHSRVDFATSMTDGRTAGELDPESRSGAEVAALWTYLHNLLTEDERYAESQSRAAE